jgi:hypothetical protein
VRGPPSHVSAVMTNACASFQAMNRRTRWSARWNCPACPVETRQDQPGTVSRLDEAPRRHDLVPIADSERSPPAPVSRLSLRYAHLQRNRAGVQGGRIFFESCPAGDKQLSGDVQCSGSSMIGSNGAA